MHVAGRSVLHLLQGAIKVPVVIRVIIWAALATTQEATQVANNLICDLLRVEPLE